MDPDAISRGPIIRNAGPAYIRDPQNPTRRLVKQEEQRAGFRTVLGPDGFAQEARTLHGERALWITGCGNVGMNPGVRCFKNGRWWGAPGPEGGAIAVSTDGRGVRLPGDNHLPGDLAFALTGPNLVTDGKVAVSGSETFADPRHLLLFPYIQLPDGLRLDLGINQLLGDPRSYDAATKGEVVAIPHSAWTENMLSSQAKSALEQALKIKGYAFTQQTPGTRGEAQIDEHVLRLRFLDGIYPHHALFVLNDGSLASLLVSGLSNRAGITIHALAELAVESGAHHAILLDNGGDVGLYDLQESRFRVRPSEPDRTESWPLSACLLASV